MEKYKVLFIGVRQIGKTSLLMTYNNKKLPEGYLPTVYDPFSKYFQNFKKENQKNKIKISFWDTARHDEYYTLLPLYFPNTDLIAICFAIDSYYSFESIENNLILDIEEYSPNSKRILIGTKIDLRNNQERINELKEENKKLITKEEGIELANKIKAIKYFECSSFNQKGIETIFNEIVLICFGKYDKEEENKKGCILN